MEKCVTVSNFISLAGLELILRTIPGGVGWVQSDYTAISVQLQLQLPDGTELGNSRQILYALLSLAIQKL